MSEMDARLQVMRVYLTLNQKISGSMKLYAKVQSHKR